MTATCMLTRRPIYVLETSPGHFFAHYSDKAWNGGWFALQGGHQE